MYWFNICIYCKMISTGSPVNTSTQLQNFPVLKNFKIDFPSSFKICNMGLLTIVTMLYIHIQPFQLSTRNLHLLTPLTHSALDSHLSSVQFSHSVMSDSLQPHEVQHARPPRPSCPSPTPGVHPNSCPLSRWCNPIISPFSSCPQSCLG